MNTEVGPRPAEAVLAPRQLFEELRRGVLGQDRALRFVAVAVHKHVVG